MILFTGDLHIDEKIVAENILPQFAEWLNEMRRVYKISVLVILGDTWNKHLDTERRISFEVLDATVDFLSSLEFDSIILLKGNHDESFVGLHNLKVFSLDKRIRIIDSPTPIIFPYKTANGKTKELETYFVPFCKDIDYFNSIISGAPETAIICMHQTIRGFLLNSKKVSEDGVLIKKPFPLVVSGDLHDYQAKNNIVYVGSPYQVRKGESMQKQVLIFSNDQIFPLEIPGKISQRFIYVKDLEEVDQYNIKGKTIVLTGSNVDPERLNQLRSSGVKVISSIITNKADDLIVPKINPTSFSVELISNIIKVNTDVCFKLIGEDILQSLQKMEE